MIMLDKITTEMNGLSQKDIMARKNLVENGKNELASIIIEIQRNEEELLVVRYSVVLRICKLEKRFQRGASSRQTPTK